MGKRRQAKTLGNAKVDLSQHTDSDGTIPVTIEFSGGKKKKKGGVSKTPSLVVRFFFFFFHLFSYSFLSSFSVH